MAKEKQETFEQIYARLEEHVAKLESGGLALEQSIALYEEGMTLARQCQERLDEAEQKITKLRESFAPVPPRSNGSQVRDARDYDYVSDDSQVEDEEDFP
jgi:exodeoxyribonuclease VII small subunit